MGCKRKLGLLAEAWVVHDEIKCFHLWVLELLADDKAGSGSLGCWRELGLVTVSNTISTPSGCVSSLRMSS